ncbi:signal transduction histidine kinase [Neorhizobium huautlense]|uniref:histidine kinase n=1 Tax=Neorhizobium huautlense TaxID=67774 RepID=A0ABT9PWE3_9HYPH|nr:ATP-binding protein [Neorhizobium huautlense]MDP9838808.1 signal transduction histidine kinase [Neorhizobium huautlense]
MAILNNTFARSSLLMLLVGGVIMLGIVLSSFFLAQNTSDYFNEVTRLRAVRTNSADLLLRVQAAETAQRGYLITREPAFLASFNEARDAIPEQLARLERSGSAQSYVPVPMDELRQLIGDKIREMESTFDRMNNNDLRGAVAIVRNDSGRQIMDRLSNILNGIIGVMDTRLTQGISELRQSSASLQWVSVGGGFVILLVVGGAIAIVGQHVGELNRARQQVETLNAGLEERVNERTEDLMRANSEIQRYAYIVSHDLRAPLVNIMGFTSELETTMKDIQAYVLAEGMPSEDQVKQARFAVEEDLPEAISFIRSSTKKMDGLINAILKISRDGRRELKPEPIDLSDMLEVTAATINHQVVEAGGEIKIAVNAAKGLVSDRFSLDQVFGNLFDNAVKYRNPEKPLSLSVRAYPVGRTALRIEVADNGRGIAPEDHERVFELFRRSGLQDQSGEGIGLAHVRSLVRNLGGDITVTSTLGGGSTFVIRLPLDLSQYVRSNGS